MKYLPQLVFSTVIVSVLTACGGSDSNEPPVSDPSLDGVWEITSDYKIYHTAEPSPESLINFGAFRGVTKIRYTDENKTAVFIAGQNYNIDGNTLTEANGSINDSVTYTIVKDGKLSGSNTAVEADQFHDFQISLDKLSTDINTVIGTSIYSYESFTIDKSSDIEHYTLGESSDSASGYNTTAFNIELEDGTFIDVEIYEDGTADYSIEYGEQPIVNGYSIPSSYVSLDIVEKSGSLTIDDTSQGVNLSIKFELNF
ncbi:MAG: hypothetical protein HRU20_20840 [Pseudomonadales bacterium]|nr:hypothetical protein [Pseudomonadales bacterium]